MASAASWHRSIVGAAASPSTRLRHLLSILSALMGPTHTHPGVCCAAYAPSWVEYRNHWSLDAANYVSIWPNGDSGRAAPIHRKILTAHRCPFSRFNWAGLVASWPARSHLHPYMAWPMLWLATWLPKIDLCPLHSAQASGDGPRSARQKLAFTL
jgi:hypothetical protein